MWVAHCADQLQGTDVVVAAVIGFPFGAIESESKAEEARRAVDRGAGELDVVVALGAVKDGDWRYVRADIAATVRAADGRLVKVIIESALLSPAEIVRACETARDGGAGYVKTSTGSHVRGGATTTAVRLMRQTVGDDMGVKAAGGIRDCVTASAMFAAGATRLGTSSAAALAECVGPGPLRLDELAALTGDQPESRVEAAR